MYRLTPILFLAILFAGPAKAQPSSFYYALEFTENKGQWGDMFQYRSDVGSGGFFLHRDGFTVLQHDTSDYNRIINNLHGHSHDAPGSVSGKGEGSVSAIEDGNGMLLRSHAYRVRFSGASTAPASEGEKVVQSNVNYFLGKDPSGWRSGIRSYQVVTYRDVYPKIDVRYYSEGGRLKYDIIARPGADLGRVLMDYEGARSLRVSNGNLIIGTSVGEVRELEPYSYQIVNGRKQEVKCRFKVKGDRVSFDVSNYDRGSTLVIDPTLIFGTYTGSSASNWGYTATPGPDGSFYAGGIVFSSGYPVSTGAVQNTFRGGTVDMGITRFSPDGRTRIYSTFIGGNGDDIPHSLITDTQGNLVILGRSNSSNYPSTGSNFGSRGGTDIVVTKLNASGTSLIGSVIIGGSGMDGANIDDKVTSNASSLIYNYGDNSRSEVVLDDAGNVYIAASTQSTNFPTLNAPQTAKAGKQDAVVLKLTPDLAAVLFSTYLGGTQDDAGFVLKVHPTNGNIYVAGATSSSDFPGNKTGTVQSAFQGQIDGFIAVLSNNGSTLIRSTYLGTSAIDIVYGIQFDKSGYPYVMGISLGNWPVLNAAYSVAGSKQFISKVEPDLSAYAYSTIYGTSSSVPNISPVAFLVDRCENVYVSGWGGRLNPCGTPGDYDTKTAGPLGMPITPDAIKSTTDNRDFYFFVLEKNAGKVLYGSYAGQSGGEGDHVDGGTSRFDSRGAIYQAVCANCGGNSACPTSPITVPFPITPGVVAPVNGALGSGTSGECNLGAIKIAFDFDGVQTGLQLAIDGIVNDSTGCAPLKVDFADTLAVAQSYTWDFGDGSPRVTTTVADVSHTFLNPGTYKVTLIATDNTKCIPTDSTFRFVNVRSDKAVPDFNPVKLLPCENLGFRFDNLTVAPPGRPFSANSFIWDFGDGTPRVVAGGGSVNKTYAAQGTYNVKLILTDPAYCNGPDSITRTVRLAPNVKADFAVNSDTACAPFTAVFKNNSVAGQQFFWDFGDGTTFTGANPPDKIYTSGGTYTVTMVANDPNTCNVTDTIRTVIKVFSNPQASFNYTPFPPVENSLTSFQNTSIGGVAYFWDFGDGDSSTQVNPVHQFRSTGTFNTCLYVINAIGCLDTICLPVQAIVVPALDVPNAFSPNGDGVNDKVFVRGFGIAKMNFRIYNRWGQLIFQSTDQSIGWDGLYKGRQQPLEVYAYVLDVEFSSGERVTKKGDITLLR